MSEFEALGLEPPSEEQMASWYAVIERIMKIQSDTSRLSNKAYAPEPLRADIQDCVDRALLVATRTDAKRAAERYILTVSPRGEAVFDMLHAHLVSTGQAEPRLTYQNSTSRSNPFDGMDD